MCTHPFQFMHYDIIDNHGNTPLHIAAMQGSLTAVKFWTENGAQADTVNEDIKTPVHLAAEKGWHR